MEGFRFFSEKEYDDKNTRVLRYCPKNATATDFAILEGAYSIKDRSKLRNIGLWWLTDFYFYEKKVICVDYAGIKDVDDYSSGVGSRPIVDYSLIGPYCNVVEELDLGLFEAKCGEYPRRVVNDELAKKLDCDNYLGFLKKSGKSYTMFVNDNGIFKPKKLDVYLYQDKKYVKVISNNTYGRTLSNGNLASNNSCWVSVEPITWIVDEKNNVAITKEIVFAGIPFDIGGKATTFEDTFIKKYMDTYFANEILPKGTLNITPKLEEEIDDTPIVPIKSNNSYGFDLGKVTEEDIIKGTIESNISLFLHGKSSDGKSARVKELDPDCEILYMRNATPDSLNGKSVYDASTGKMIDVPPTWYKNVVDKCTKEPEKIHLVFFDELTNALPSMQGMAFNIILDREVNGKWKLPKNVRIVAAGNDLSDSLAANKMAEPLFNRFAHVYIKTGVEDWLKWAIEDKEDYQRFDYEKFDCEEKIHPAIISYIEDRNNKGYNVLRTSFTGEKPNADPRKWEMASKVLYKTNKPEMLKALVGEELTNDFIRFVSYELDESKKEEKRSKRLSI